MKLKTIQKYDRADRNWYKTIEMIINEMPMINLFSPPLFADPLKAKFILVGVAI